MKTQFLILFLALASLLPSAKAQFTYTTNNSAIIITDYTGSGGAVVIPASINGYPVTAIDDYAFYDASLTGITIPGSVTSLGDDAFAECTKLTSVTIGNGVTSLGNGAFAECTSLTSVTLPDSVTSLGDDAFLNCTSLTSVAIGNGVTNIGEQAFYFCTSLTSITVAAGNPDYSSVNGVLFDQQQATLIQYPAGISSSSYTISNSVTSLGFEAFVACTHLTNVTIPVSVTNISGGAFDDCDNLTSITVVAGNPDYSSVNGVLLDENQTTLIECPGGLHSYAIPASVTSISDDGFAYCYYLTGVTIPNSVTSIGETAFWGCESLTNVTIPVSVTSIGYGAFAYCTSLTNITVVAGNPDYSSVNGVLFDLQQATLIQYPAGISSSSYTISNSVTLIGADAFAGCAKLTGVTIPNSVTIIDTEALGYCSGLTNVTIPASVTLLSDYAFWYCASLTNITFLGNAPDPADDVFDDDAAAAKVYYFYGTSGWGSTYDGLPTVGLTSYNGSYNGFQFTLASGVVTITGYTGSGGAVTIPATIYGYPVITIGTDAFYDKTAITSITIPDSVISIGTGAFENEGSGLTNIILPASLTSIGTNAFYNDYLYNVIIPDNVTNIGDYAFYYCNYMTRITLGNSMTSIGQNTFQNCYALTSVVLPAGLTNIGSEAFYDCYNLTNFTFLGNAPTLGTSAFTSVASSAKVYYYSDTTGWSSTYGGLPTVELLAPPEIGGGGTNGGGSVGMQSGGNFGFGITGASGQTITIEASTNLVDWQVVQTITLSGTSTNFTDAQWTHYPNRYYRVR